MLWDDAIDDIERLTTFDPDALDEVELPDDADLELAEPHEQLDLL